MEYFCDNPECINHQKHDCDEIKIIPHGEELEKVIKRHDAVDRNGKTIKICSACRNAIIMIVG